MYENWWWLFRVNIKKYVLFYLHRLTKPHDDNFHAFCIVVSWFELLCVTVYSSDILVCWLSVFIQATNERYIHLNQHNEDISERCCPSVCNANQNAYSSFIIDSRIIIRISDERAWHSLQENEAIFSKIVFQLRICLLLLVEWYFAHQVKGLDDWCPIQ